MKSYVLSIISRFLIRFRVSSARIQNAPLWWRPTKKVANLRQLALYAKRLCVYHAEHPGIQVSISPHSGATVEYLSCLGLTCEQYQVRQKNIRRHGFLNR
jgi:hypothetical protein